MPKPRGWRSDGDDEKIDPVNLAQFRNARNRPLAKNLDYSFIRTHRPVLDYGKSRSFDTMAEYRVWCNKNLSRWLGFWSEEPEKPRQ